MTSHFLAWYSHFNKKRWSKVFVWARTVALRDMMWSCKCFPCLFFSLFLEGPPKFGMTPDSVTIGYRKSVNSRVMDVQITYFGDFIHKIELDYDNEYFYFDTRLRTYWRHLLQ
jgi:hypothetical protein